MAKGNMLQGQARGKVGDLVFSVLKGQQVSKVYNAKPSNPKTTSQMAQRVKLGAAVGFYKRNKPFFKFAFKKKATESDYNAFIRNNINIAPYLSKEDVVNNNLCPAPYIMTQGDLVGFDPLIVSHNTYTGEASERLGEAVVVLPFEGETTTFGHLREIYDLNYGDMLTVYVVVSSFSGDASVSPVINNEGVVCYAQVVFTAEKDNQPFTQIDNWDNVLNLADVEASDYEDIDLGLLMTFRNSKISDFAVSGKIAIGSCSVISRKVAGSGLSVSTSRMVLSENASLIYAKYRDEATLQKAMDSYGRQDNAFLEPSEPILRG